MMKLMRLDSNLYWNDVIEPNLAEDNIKSVPMINNILTIIEN